MTIRSWFIQLLKRKKNGQKYELGKFQKNIYSVGIYMSRLTTKLSSEIEEFSIPIQFSNLFFL